MRKFSADLARAISFLLLTGAFVLSASAQESSAINLKNNSTAENRGGGATAQTGGATDGKNELSVEGGFAPDIKRIFGGARPSKFGFAAVRYSRRLLQGETVALKYTVDFIPLALINYQKLPVVQTAPNTFVVQPERTTAYAVGLTPVGFQLNFRRQKKVQPFLAANAGLLYFNKLIPDDRSAVFPDRKGRRLNFTLAAGGGVEIATAEGKSFTVGFKFHHISNASTGNINPGFDQNLFYVGYTFKKW